MRSRVEERRRRRELERDQRRDENTRPGQRTAAVLDAQELELRMRKPAPPSTPATPPHSALTAHSERDLMTQFAHHSPVDTDATDRGSAGVIQSQPSRQKDRFSKKTQ